MGTTKEKTAEVVVARTFFGHGRMFARGQRLAGDDPAVAAAPTHFSPAPPTDGSLLAACSRVTPYGRIVLGQIFHPDDPVAAAYPDVMIPGPVDRRALQGIARAIAFNRPAAREARKRDADEYGAKRRGERERRAAVLQAQADALALKAEELLAS